MKLKLLFLSALLASIPGLAATPAYWRPPSPPKKRVFDLAHLKEQVFQSLDSECRYAPVQWAVAIGMPVDTRFDDAYHSTPLIEAAGLGCPDIVRLLLRHGANVNARDENQRHTALWGATNTGVVRLLLSHGARIDAADENGVTPLDIAAFWGREQIVALLLRAGANPNRRDVFRKTPIEWAAYNGYTRIVRILKAKGAKVYTRKGLPRSNQRLLDAKLQDAIGYHRVIEVKQLLACGADPNALVGLPTGKDETGPPNAMEFFPPLITAANSPLLTRLLMDHGADPNIRNEEGITPLMSASTDVAKVLLARGADPNARSDNGSTPLMSNDLIETHADDPERARLLLRYGANVNARDRQGNTPLMGIYREDVLKLFLAHGADIDARDREGKTALMQAARIEWGEGGNDGCEDDWAEILLRHGAKPNLRDANGNTPLMTLAAQEEYRIATHGNQVRFARYLLRYGARADLKDRKGRTALQIARQSGAKSLARLLQKRISVRPSE